MTDNNQKKYCPKCKKDVALTESMKCIYCGLTLTELKEVIGDADRQRGLIVEDEE
jgi:hypothetical protein